MASNNPKDELLRKVASGAILEPLELEALYARLTESDKQLVTAFIVRLLVHPFTVNDRRVL